jgi:hypothetical protein
MQSFGQGCMTEKGSLSHELLDENSDDEETGTGEQSHNSTIEPYLISCNILNNTCCIIV